MGYKVGDVIELKSGGPKMTVKIIVGDPTNGIADGSYKMQGFVDGDIGCNWFIKDVLKDGLFKADMVKLCEEK